MVKSTNNTGFLKKVIQFYGELKIHNQFIDGSNISLSKMHILRMGHSMDS